MPDNSSSNVPMPRLGAAVTWAVLHPLRLPPWPTPRTLGLSYRRVRLEGATAPLAAWHIPCEGSRAGLVLCHGHNNSRAQFSRLIRPLHEAGFHLLLFDFPSMGLSGGSTCTYGAREYRDVLATVEWLRRETGIDRVGLMGLSMGGACALLAAAADPTIDAVVADCAFARLEDMVEQRFFFLPRMLRRPLGHSVRTLAQRWTGIRVEEVSPEAALSGWRQRPLLLIHGERDRTIPVFHSRRLAAAAGPQAELWVVPGAGHVGCHLKLGEAYRQRLIGFFRTHLGAGLEPHSPTDCKAI